MIIISFPVLLLLLWWLGSVFQAQADALAAPETEEQRWRRAQSRLEVETLYGTEPVKVRETPASTPASTETYTDSDWRVLFNRD